jgi:hypothetical protein
MFPPMPMDEFFSSKVRLKEGVYNCAWRGSPKPKEKPAAPEPLAVPTAKTRAGNKEGDDDGET